MSGVHNSENWTIIPGGSPATAKTTTHTNCPHVIYDKLLFNSHEYIYVCCLLEGQAFMVRLSIICSGLEQPKRQEHIVHIRAAT